MKNYKKDFPIFKTHPNLVYLDSAATSQKPQAVIDSIVECYKIYNANVRRGLYPIAEKATEKVEEVRKKVAEFVNAKDPTEIIFVRNTTEALNLVAYAFASHNIKKGDGTMTTIMEHHSNFVPWQQITLQKKAYFEVFDIDSQGLLLVDYDKLKGAKLFTLTYVSNVLGTINPVEKIVKRARENNKDLVVVVDAAQAVPHMKVDVKKMDCDFMAFSMHKAFGPTGVGILYAKLELLEKMHPFLFGGEMVREVSIEKTTFDTPPFKFEAGTPDIAGIIGLGAAIDYMKKVGMDSIAALDKELVYYALKKMTEIEGLKIYGPKDMEKRGSVIAFNIRGIHPHDIAQILGEMGICIRAGHHCAMPLHKRLGIPASARMSVQLYNDKEDIDRLVEGLKKAKHIFDKS